MDRAAQGVLPRRERVMTTTSSAGCPGSPSCSAAHVTRCCPSTGWRSRCSRTFRGTSSLTVTASPTKGLEPTLGLVESLSRHGYAVVPHLSARLVADAAELAEIVARLRAVAVRDVFVVAGDPEEPRGKLPRRRSTCSRRSTSSVARSPRWGSPAIRRATRSSTTRRRSRRCSRSPGTPRTSSSQVCFDPAVTAQWIEDVWARGTRLPIYIGVPGAVSRAKLLRVSDPDRDRRLAALPAEERQLREPLPARRLQPDALVDGLGPVLDRGEGRRLPCVHVQRRRGHRTLAPPAAGLGFPGHEARFLTHRSKESDARRGRHRSRRQRPDAARARLRRGRPASRARPARSA